MAVITLSAAKKQIKDNREKFYSYILFRPDGRPFYVGMGTKWRISAHERDARTSRRGHKYSIIRSIISSGLNVGYSIIFFDTRDEANQSEVDLIAMFGRLDTGRGPLLNFTDGGDGTAGKVLTPAQRERVSKINIGRIASPEIRARMSASQKARWAEDAGLRDRQSRLRKAMWADDSHREKVRKTKAARPLSPEAKAKIDTALRNRKISDETREKLRAHAFTRSHSAETRKKIGDVQRGVKHTAEHKAKISAGLLGRVHSAETRAKLSAAATRQHARNKAAQACQIMPAQSPQSNLDSLLNG